MHGHPKSPLHNIVLPPVAALILAFAWGRPIESWLLALVGLAVIGAVLVAVHHAEVIAHRLGEPFGTLILALAVTVIEVALIISVMLSGDPSASTLASHTVFAAIMIVCNGVVGVCLLMGSLKHHVVAFRIEGTSPALSVLAALAGLTLILPDYTTSTPGPTYAASQLVFAGVMSLLLYATFVFVQTVRHRDYFLPIETASVDPESHAAPPSKAATAKSAVLLLICLIDVVGLAKTLSPSIQNAVTAMNAPDSVVGIAIALLVLLPETVAALQAALRNRMQTSLNLALGSVLATIGLTIPSVAAISLMIHMPLALGIGALDTSLLVVTLIVSTTTLASGRATMLQGAVHLVLFMAFLFLSVVP